MMNNTNLGNTSQKIPRGLLHIRDKPKPETLLEVTTGSMTVVTHTEGAPASLTV